MFCPLRLDWPFFEMIDESIVRFITQLENSPERADLERNEVSGRSSNLFRETSRASCVVGEPS
jgi:hypothetical protein